MMLSDPHRRRLCRILPSPAEDQAFLMRSPGSPRFGRANGFGRFQCLSLAATAAAVLLGFSLPAHASLGGTVSTVESDRAQMRASIQVTQHDAYDVHEMQVSGGSTIVDEYVTPQGKVFAVTWHGEFPPPMQQILGTYFHQYSAALTARPRMYGHRPLNIQQEGLVVQTGGHMRAHYGRAYVPGLLPQGMTLNQIQ